MSLDEQMARVSAVQARYAEQLMHKKHVVGVGIGLKMTGGASTGELALVVMVEKKLPEHELDPEDRIPAELDGVRVDVQEVGVFTAF